MNYLHWKIDGRPGDKLMVKMDTPAFVRLLDPLNFEYYRVGKKFDGPGGWNERLQAEFEVPYKGTFHVVVDLGTAPGVLHATLDITRS
jgi:hypothetical protein